MIPEEDKYTEYKKTYTKTLLKTVSAFANYGDGKIIIGIDDHKNIVGVDNIIELKLNIENSINDNIIPSPFYEFESQKIDNKSILIINVFLGENTPYLYKGKAYKRSDTSTTQVDRYAYENLILKGQNKGFDELRYTNDDLSFDYLNKKLRTQLNIGKISDDILKSLYLINKSNYTNAAALLSDNNPIETAGISLVRYENDNVSNIKDSIILNNKSILELFDISLDFYQKHINISETITESYRITTEEIPKIAYREAISNALVHRDYLINSNIRVEIFDNRVEIISPGSLPIGITKEEYLNGRISIPRNKILANIFYRLGIIERLATGIRRINESYKKYKVKPEYSILQNSITIILPNVKKEISKPKNKKNTYYKLSKEEKTVLNYINKNNIISRSEVELLLNKGKTLSVKLLNILVKKDLIQRIGKGRNTKYIIKK